MYTIAVKTTVPGTSTIYNNVKEYGESSPKKLLWICLINESGEEVIVVHPLYNIEYYTIREVK